MTTTPAMPELPEPELGHIETDKSRQPAFSARQMRAALQAQPAEVSDELIDQMACAEIEERFPLEKGPTSRQFYLGYTAGARAILALRPQSESEQEKELRRSLAEAQATISERNAEIVELQKRIRRSPQAVPMTEKEFVACLTKANCIGVVKMSYDSGPYDITRPSINASKLKEAVEAHYGITAPAGGEKQA